MRGKFISYLRVSTDKQGRDGNGLAAHGPRPFNRTSRDLFYTMVNKIDALG
jgi:hypothetical protein